MTTTEQSGVREQALKDARAAVEMGEQNVAYWGDIAYSARGHDTLAQNKLWLAAARYTLAALLAYTPEEAPAAVVVDPAQTSLI